MAISWSEVAKKPEFLALSAEDQEATRDLYFREVVAPQVATGELDTVRAAFDSDTRPTTMGRIKDQLSNAFAETPSVTDRAAAISEGAQERPAPGDLAPLSEAGYNRLAQSAQARARLGLSPLDAMVDRAAGVDQPQLGSESAAPAGIVARGIRAAQNDANTRDQLQSVDGAITSRAPVNPDYLPNRSAVEFAKDQAAGVVQGGVNAVKGAAWLAGKAGLSGDVNDSIMVGAKSVADDMEKAKSEQSRAISEYIDNQTGFWNTVGKAVENPAYIADTISENALLMLPGMGLASAGGKVGSAMLATKTAQAALAKVGMEAATTLSAQGATLPVLTAGIKAAQQQAASQIVGNFATAGAILGEGLTSAGITGADVQDFVRGQKFADLEQNSPRFTELAKTMPRERARAQLADELSGDAAMKAGAWTSLVAGVTGAGSFMGKVAAGTERFTVKQAIKDTGKETLDETLQNPGEDYAAFAAKRQADPSQTFDLGSSAAQGAIGGFGQSAGMNVLHAANTGMNAPHQAPAASTPFPDAAPGSLSSAANIAAKAGMTPAQQPAPVAAPATTTTAISDEDVADFAEGRMDELRAKRDGRIETVVGDSGIVDQEVPGIGLTQAETQEMAALEHAQGNAPVLRELYGIPSEDGEHGATAAPVDTEMAGRALASGGTDAAGSGTTDVLGHDSGPATGERGGSAEELVGGAGQDQPVSDAGNGAVAETGAEPVPQVDTHAGKWFGSPQKANDYISKKKIGATHHVVQRGKKFEIHPKEQANGTQTTQAEQSEAQQPTKIAAESVNTSKEAQGTVPKSVQSDTGGTQQPATPLPESGAPGAVSTSERIAQLTERLSYLNNQGRVNGWSRLLTREKNAVNDELKALHQASTPEPVVDVGTLRAKIKGDSKFKEAFKSPKGANDLHIESGPALSFLRGYLDAEAGRDMDEAKVSKPTPDMRADGFNPVDHYVSGYLSQKNGAPVNRRVIHAEQKTHKQEQPKADTLVKTRTIYGDTIHVKQSDLDGDRPLIQSYTAKGERKDKVHRENIDMTGEKQAAMNAEGAGNPLFDVITKKDGTPFASRFAAQRELGKQGRADTHEVVAASDVTPGATGFVLRKKIEQPASENEKFNSDLDSYLSGEFKSGRVFVLGKPGNILSQFGLGNLEIQMPQSIVKKGIEKHSIEAEDLRDLPRHIQNPLAVFASKSNPDARILLTEIDHPDGNLVVALHTEIERGKLVVHDIRSIHPKSGEKITRWVEDGLLLGVDKNKGRHLLPATPEYDSQGGNNEATSGIILYETTEKGNEAAKNEEPRSSTPEAESKASFPSEQDVAGVTPGLEAAAPQQNQEQQAIAILDRATVTGKDRLDIMRDFKDGKHTLADLEAAYPAKTSEAGASDKSAKEKADTDFEDALGDLGDIIGKNFRATITPEQEQKLMPVLTRLFDAAFRKGYYKFKEAARFVLDAISSRFGNDVADEITLDHLQGAYIGMAGRYKDQGADSARDVVSVQDKQEVQDVTDERSSTDLERNSQDAEVADGVGAQGVRAGRNGNGRAGGQRVQGAEDEGGAGSGDGVSGREAAAGGEHGNLEIYTGAPPTEASIARDSINQRSDSSGVDGAPIESDATGVTEELAESRLSLEQAKLKQLKADKAEHKPGLTNIRETLPILTDGQQEDVHIAETRFSQPDGYGMLFTNGTGTGKTFTGLGVIKRFDTAGKSNIIIVVPNDKIAEDWQKSGTLLGLNISRLNDTKSAGSGIVITTYANFGQNNALAKRNWDLIVHDEAHYLKMDSKGSDTLALGALRAISLHPDGAATRASMLHADLLKEIGNLDAQAKMMRTGDNQDEWYAAGPIQDKADALRKEFEGKRDAIREEVKAKQGESRPRVLFLSATPFAYEKTVDWANGYLFDYNEGQSDESREFRGYNAGSNSDQFMMQHFGYRMRYNKLTEPDAKVDRGLMQRQFNTWLKKRGVLSGRMLDVKADYDRKFILTESAIGQRIDEALQWFEKQRKETEDKVRTAALHDVSEIIAKKFDYLSRRYLLEAIKAQEVIPHVKEHMALGRKVVVFHDYKKGGGFNPFDLSERGRGEEWSTSGDTDAINGIIQEFRAEFKDLIQSDVWRASSPIDAFQKAFPGVLLFNGDIPSAQRRANVAKFQDDASGVQIMLVQSAAGKEGISLHDTTGKYQRVLFNLGQPTQPTTAIQQEGRIYRTGQVTDAIIRYLNTGTNWERWAFAQTIASRASAAENLGMGELARSLKDAFIAGFEESDDYRAGMEGEGKGGKERDKAANNALTEYDRARAFYFGTQKKNSKTKAQEGADYFATPEPVGLKMVELADIRPGESVLEPSAGHGAIARWMPEDAVRTAIEPSTTLRSRLAMVFDGNIIDTDFESLHVANKYDAIVMNPPFGSAGRTAIDHIAKAATHLREGGRIVALIPRGSADNKFDKWFYEEGTKPAKPLGSITIDGNDTPIYKGDTVESRASWAPAGVVTGWRDGAPMVKASAPEFRGAVSMVSKESIKSVQPTGKRTETFRPAEGLHLVAELLMPTVTFERAGTGVSTRIIVIEKSEKAPPLSMGGRDYTDITDINELFDRMENLSIPARIKPVEEVEAAKEVKADQAGAAEDFGFKLAETKHAKKNNIPLYVASLDRRVERDEYTRLNDLAKKHGGYYSAFKGNGAIPRFQFEKLEDRQKFIDAATEDNLTSLSLSPRVNAGAVDFATTDAVVRRVVAAKKGWNVEIGTFATFDALPPEVQQATIQDYGEKDAKKAKGIVHDGKVYIVAENNESEADVESTVLHEVEGHIGIRRLYGKEIIQKLNNLYVSIGGLNGLKRIVKQRGMEEDIGGYALALDKNERLTDEQKLFVLMDEVLAHYAQHPRFSDRIKAIVGSIRAKLRELGFAKLAEYGETDLLHILQQGRAQLKTNKDATGGVTSLMVAWHGSPHDHDKFDSSKIGTGEGAQAYGHGLYFASNREVAEWYRKNLTGNYPSFSDGRRLSGGIADANTSDERLAEIVLSPTTSISEGREAIQKNKNYLGTGGIDIATTWLDNGDVIYPDNKGRLYQVELAPEENEYLLWDKPLSEQSEKVKAALSNAGVNVSAQPSERKINGKYQKSQVELGKDLYASLSESLAPTPIDDLADGGWGSFTQTVNDRHANDKAASERLHSIGIRGIKYLDGSSRNQGEGSYNYVIFNDEDVSITAKFGEASQELALHSPKAQYNENQLDLFKDPYESLETRPETTEAQLDAGRESLAAIERRFFGRDSSSMPVPASVLGSSTPREFRERGVISLIGQQVKSSRDLALVAQILRDPRFETFRVIYTKDGKIVGERAYSSRLAGVVHLPTGMENYVTADMARTGATGYWLLHNHPSGKAKASNEDIALTENLANITEGMLGHVIIDHNEYNAITLQEGRYGLEAREQVTKADLGALASEPEVPHELIGATLSGVPEFAGIAKRLQQNGVYSSVIGRDGQGKVAMVLDMPLLEDGVSDFKRLRVASLIRRAAAQTGSVEVFAVVPDELSHYSKLLNGGLFRDVISQKTGESAAHSGGMVSRNIRGTRAQKRGKLLYLAQPVNAPYNPTPETTPEPVQKNAIKFFGDRKESLKTFGLYDKTLSTQYHKALKDPHYGKVFGLVNAMQNEVSLTSIRPAELAPGVLPRVDDVKAAFKGAFWKNQTNKADLSKAAQAIFAGTLYGETVLGGKVWTDDELRGEFGLTEHGIALYHQTRDAIDASLDEVAAAEAYAMAQGMLPKTLRRDVVNDPRQAETLIVRAINKQIKLLETAIRNAKSSGDENRLASLEETRAAYLDTRTKAEKIFVTAKNLKHAGYAPLMRFGKWTVTVHTIDPATGQVLRDEEGNQFTEYFGKFETEGEAISMKHQMEAKYKERDDIRVVAGEASQAAHELYAGISPETIALFGEAVGADAVTRKYYQMALSERSALKRRLERKGTAGYSEDMPRVLSNFITSNGRFAAQRYYLRDLNNAIKYIPLNKGGVKDEAMRLKQFILNPNDPAAPVSSIMFAWFLGGSVAAAAVNMTQPVLMTGPYLAQHGVTAASKALTKAIPYAMGKKAIDDADLSAALKRASQEGIVDAQEIFHLYTIGAQGVASGLANTLARMPVVGKTIKAGSEQARARINAFLTLWGSMFSLAERFNRKLTFIAAWEVAKIKGVQNKYAFAVRAVNETQGIYNKVNRPNWARGPAGRTILTFKQFSLMYVELLSRMLKRGGPEGKRAALIMLAMMLLAAGEEGLPFAQDLDDLIDTIGQMFGLDTNMRRNKREAAYAILGKELGDLLLYGASAHLPIDFAGRLGLGNMIPGTGLLKPSDEKSRGRNVAEILGPTAGMATQIGDAYDAITDGETGKAVQNAAPKAIKDVLSAAEMAKKGFATDAKGRRVVSVGVNDIIAKGIGFNPTKVAQEHRKTAAIQQDISLQKHTEGSIVNQWAAGLVDGDQSLVEKAQARIESWNKANPRTPIFISGAQISYRARELMLEKDMRLLKNAPKELKGRVMGEVVD